MPSLHQALCQGLEMQIQKRGTSCPKEASTEATPTRQNEYFHGVRMCNSSLRGWWWWTKTGAPMRRNLAGGFPGSLDGKESACNVGDPGSISGPGKILWRRARQPTPVF